MRTRQTMPDRWLIVSREIDEALWTALKRLPRRSGVLLLQRQSEPTRQRLRNLAKLRGLTVVKEAAGTAARIHDMRELRRALALRTPLLLVSPIYPTRSHPAWRPLPLMRAAALAQLAGRQAIALGGMNEARFKRLQPLGFIAWAGIEAWTG